MNAKPTKLLVFHFSLLSVLYLSGCNMERDKAGLDPLSGEVSFRSVQQSIIVPHCISCHSGTSAQILDFSSYAKLLESGSVIPFKPEQSTFFASVESGRMPKGSSKLKDFDIQRIFDWIAKGATENASVEPAPTPEPVPEPTLASIQKNFVDRRCVSCHLEALHSNRHVKLTSLLEVTEGSGSSGHARKVIKPGCPKQSFFLSIMKEGKMPPKPSAKTSPEWLKAIETWIISLNPNAGPTCDDEPGGPD